MKAETWLTSPSLAARQTAERLGVEAEVEEAVRDIDHGRWRDRSFADVMASEPEVFAAWIADPTSAAPGGERLDDVRRRLEPWLTRLARPAVSVAAVTHPTVIRAALSVALDAPLHATLRIDIAPMTAVIFSFHAGWRLKAIRPT